MRDESLDDGAVVETVALTKIFGYKRVLKGVTLQVYKGETFGFLGSNGAGKTTLLSILATVLKPTSGEAKVYGYGVRDQGLRIKQMVGYLCHEPPLYGDLTGDENLRFYLRFYPYSTRKNMEDRIGLLMDMLRISRWKHEPVKNLSSGLRKRFDIARALVHDPPLLLFDEPFSGLDIQSQRLLQDFITKMRGEKTFIISSHDILLASQICSRAAILAEGELLKVVSGSEITPEKILDTVQKGRVNS